MALHLPLRKKRIVFERTGQDFHWGEASGQSNVRKLADIIAPAVLFLSVSARFDPQRTAGGSRAIRYGTWPSDPSIHAAVVGLLRAADIGLQSVLAEPPNEEFGRDRINFVHHGAAEDVAFSIADESSGTLRLLEIAANAVPILDGGGLFLVDEIDASLHPLLTAALVRLFQSPEANKRRAQLVFTTHDATLLGSIDGEDVLRRDQVWFTSRRIGVVPVAKFKPRRQGENRQKRYLNGSYGAIPELSMRLFEQAVTSGRHR